MGAGRQAMDIFSEEEARKTQRERARTLGFAFVDVQRITVERSTIELLTPDFVRRYMVLPVKRLDEHLYVAMVEPNDLTAIRALDEATGLRIIPCVAIPEAIDQALHRYYPAKTER
jgi:hypothetical protein